MSHRYRSHSETRVLRLHSTAGHKTPILARYGRNWNGGYRMSFRNDQVARAERGQPVASRAAVRDQLWRSAAVVSGLTMDAWESPPTLVAKTR
jgi:hypothetical protein